MKTDRQFYEMILEKQKQHHLERRRRRGATIGLCMLCTGMACMLIVFVKFFPVSYDGSTPTSSTTTGITFHNGESDIHKFPGVIGIGGADPFLNKPLHDCISLDSAFDALADPTVYDQWLKTFSHAGGTRNSNEYNLYNFIHELNIPREEFEKVCESHNQILEYDYYTPEQIEVLYTYSKDDAYRYFALDTTVIVGNSFYAIGWLAEHTAADYINAGMTANQVKKAYEAITDNLIDAEKEHILRQLAIMDPSAVPTTTTSYTTATHSTEHSAIPTTTGF